MAKLSEIEPTKKPNLIDLVEAAGVNVSDWANCDTYPSRNPKYCYEWSFVEPRKVVVLNLWHGMMNEQGGKISIELNNRQFASEVTDPNRKNRALVTDEAIQISLRENLPIRVIVLKEKVSGKYETVWKRLLDPLVWVITSYNPENGQCFTNARCSR